MLIGVALMPVIFMRRSLVGGPSVDARLRKASRNLEPTSSSRRRAVSQIYSTACECLGVVGHYHWWMTVSRDRPFSRGGGSGQTDELQELVDAWSHRLGRSIAIDDMNIRMLAVSAHFGDEDPARVHAVMHRGLYAAPPEFVRSHRVTEFDSPGWVPGNDDLGMFPRFIVPIRHHGVPLGFLALVDRDRNVSEETANQAVEAARDAGIVLYRRLVLRERLHN